MGHPMYVILANQYFDHLMERTESLEKALMLRKKWGQEKGVSEDETAG